MTVCWPIYPNMAIVGAILTLKPWRRFYPSHERKHENREWSQHDWEWEAIYCHKFCRYTMLMIGLLISGAAASNFRLEKTWKFWDRDRGVPDRSRTVINDSLVCECKLLEVLRRSANSEVRKHWIWRGGTPDSNVGKHWIAYCCLLAAFVDLWKIRPLEKIRWTSSITK